MPLLKKKAATLIDAAHKAYVTSDNSLFKVKRDTDIGPIIKHCTENGLTLFDVEEGKNVELKKAKKVKDVSAQG
jgi:hypothetical protein